MKSWFGSRYFWGGLIVLAGVILLLQSLDLIEFGFLLWSFLFALGGAIFLSIFASNRENWWAIIPGLTLISIALLIGLEYFAPDLADDWGGSIVLLGIGSSFVVIYLLDHQNWWAIIPAGVLISIAVVIGVEEYVSETAFVGLFFMGIGLTFGLLALLPSPQGKLSWSWIPAGILSIMGLVFLLLSGDVFRIIGAVALIFIGAYFIYRTVRSR